MGPLSKLIDYGSIYSNIKFINTKQTSFFLLNSTLFGDYYSFISELEGKETQLLLRVETITSTSKGMLVKGILQKETEHFHFEMNLDRNFSGIFKTGKI